MADRSRGRIFLEDVLGIRIKGKPNIRSTMPNTAGTPEDLIDILNNIESSADISGVAANLSELTSIKQISSDIENRYRIYDEMEMDSIISGALDMYADDATQYNSEGSVIWAASDDTDVANFANRLIDIFQLNSRSWSYIRSLIKYGDLYLETFRDDETGDDLDPYETDTIKNGSDIKIHKPAIGAKLEEYIQKVDNPAIIYDLSRKGKTVGYIKVKPTIDTTEMKYTYQSTIGVQDCSTILPSDKFVHICLPSDDRFPEEINVTYSNNENSNTMRYKINRGKSILHNVYKVYKELQLMEDSVLLNRVTRSSIIRILQIEVGDMPKAQAREVLKRFKTIIEQKNFMDKTDGTYSSQASPGPIDNCIYVPTYNGKGAVSASNLGGDVDVKSIIDLDYFREKLSGAGLKIPLSYISGTAQENGLGGGSSLTKIDARYARTVKGIQNAYIQGITTLINIFAIDKGLGDKVVNNFTIKMVSPTTQEDAERDEIRGNKIELANSIMEMLNNLEDISPDAKRDIVTYLINNYIDESSISDILNEYAEQVENANSDNGGIDGGDFDIGSTPDISGADDFGSDMGDFNGGTDDFDTAADFSNNGSDDFGDFEDNYEDEI